MRADGPCQAAAPDAGARDAQAREAGEPDAVTVGAAQRGDRQALDSLIAWYLPLLYNIVGRALGGHADVDDVVQETVLRAIRGLGELRDPARFRPWLVAIAVRQVRDRARARRAAPLPDGDLHGPLEPADPGSDFVGLTITRLGLSGQRREVAEATRWLDPADRHLLSLWWLEVAGELTRAEVAAALALSPRRVAARVQRLKAELDATRIVVRALASRQRCLGLTELTREWEGHRDAVWRRRVLRHTRACAVCTRHRDDLFPADALLTSLGLVPVPVMLQASVTGAHAAPVAPAITGGAAASGFGAASASGLASHTAALTTVGAATVAAAVTGLVVLWPSPPPTPGVPHPPPAASATPHRASPGTTPATLPAPAVGPTAAQPTPTPAVLLPTAPALPRYGQNVDTADQAPPKGRRPGSLPRRPEGPAVTAVSGNYQNPYSGAPGGSYVMTYRGESITLQGRGYVQVRYQIAFSDRAGSMVMPTWTGLRGKLFHVASGGLRRMDDPKPNDLPDTDTWMGEPDRGYVVLPEGAQQMWQNEFFYLDGEVTLHNNERGADYNITATPKTWAQVTADITTPPPADPEAAGWVRYGLVRDTGDDSAPVPQYVTRDTPTDPATVPQKTQVS